MKNKDVHSGMFLLRKLFYFYNMCISPWFERRCKYEPTCSAYCYQSIQVHGIFKGTLLSVWRIIRCNPWSSGGVDWVPEKGRWPMRPLNYEELMEYRQRQRIDTHTTHSKMSVE